MLKLTKRGEVWYLRGTVRGLPVYESAKTTDRGYAEALRIRREGDLLDRSIHGASATATFVEAAVGYMEQGGELRYLGPLIDHFGTVPLARIDQAAIDRAARVLKPAAKPSTVNRQIHSPMAAVMHFAAKRKLCGYQKIERPKQPKGRVRWLRPHEAERLIDACAPHLAPLVIFLLYTGARVSEAVHLDWSEVDLARRRVVFLDTKNGEDRGVPLHSRAFEALANLPHRDGAVFRCPNFRPYVRRLDSGGQIRTAFKAACRRAGINDFRPHDCRHTWATWLYSETRDLRLLMDLGGWKTIALVERYAHVDPDHLRPAIDALPDGAKSVHGALVRGTTI